MSSFIGELKFPSPVPSRDVSAHFHSERAYQQTRKDADVDMHCVAGSKPLGEQHARRLRQLRDANDRHIHRLHLQSAASRGGEPPGERSVSPQRVDEGKTPRGERAVEAIIEARRDADGRAAASTATRLREKISAARRGIQTERSDQSPRDPTLIHRRPLLPSLGNHTGCALNGPVSGDGSKCMLTTRKIGTVRRRYAFQRGEQPRQGKRRMGKDEAEWLEKQLQFSQRASALERECLNAWRSFYSSASTTSSSSPSNAPSVINKQFEEIGLARTQDGRVLLQQLSTLRQKATRIALKVHEMRDGTQFYSELEDLIEDMEQSLLTFRESQLVTYEKYVLEENMLEKDISAFLEKMETWEQSDRELPSRSQRLDAKQGSRSRELDRNQLDSNNDAALQGNGTEGPTEEELVNRVRHLNDTIMQSGGLKDGWDDRDHAIFLQELSKCGLSNSFLLRQDEERNSSRSNQRAHDSNHVTTGVDRDIDYETLVARFIRKCTIKLVTKTADGVRSHWRWYIGHTKLVDEKKRVIAEWKQRKEKQRRELLSGTEDYNAFDEQAMLGNAGKDQRVRKGNSSPDSDKDAAERAEKAQRLREWKEQKLQQELEYEKEQQMIREEREAKRKQAHLDAKQKLLLYKLQKEEEANLLKPVAREPPTTPSPPRKEELMERSRQAIEQAKAKREQLEALEARRKIQTTLPPRPESAKRLIESKLKATDGAAVLQATESFKARVLSKQGLRKKSRERQRQNAHDAYIPGGDVASEVKVKSFGHIPIQPRAIPAWRKQL